MGEPIGMVLQSSDAFVSRLWAAIITMVVAAFSDMLPQIQCSFALRLE